MTKAMANRLQSILGQVISLNQSAFAKGRLITDNILLAQELNHYIKNRRNTKVGYASLNKIDMSKAYDRLEWDFIKQMLLKLGFAREWVDKRGLRQGDPLSPYIFILSSEWLSMEIEARNREGALRGISICQGGPKISHLFFADDCMIYLRANTSDFVMLKKILEDYEYLSGQKINLSKSEAFFSPNVQQECREQLGGILGIASVQHHSKYLGLPLAVGQRKSDIFRYIIDKVWSRVNGWKEKLLSIAGKEVLIKSVLLATPLYSMSCFSLPGNVLNKLSSAVYSFWWANVGSDRGIHWVKKEKLEEEKIKGGLGFKNFKWMNEDLIAKQA
ncbi:unnamed protein product [Rhodiola kirilowii]